MCSKGSPSTTTSNNQTSNQFQNGQTVQTASSAISPNAATAAAYQDFLNSAQGTSGTPFDLTTLQQIGPWTAMQEQAANNLWTIGQGGMQYVPEAAALIGQAGQSTIGQIPGVAASMLSPWAGQAVDYGMAQGNQISNYARNLAAQGPQLQQFSQAAIDQYMSPYINDVVNATQNQFTNANAQQGNVLLGQGIRQGNAFGGDRAGIAQAQLANQQQLAQAPVIAGLYNTGYSTALGEFNTQNALAAQLGQAAIQGQIAGGQLGMQGLNIGNSAATAANQQAIAALGQNQQAQLQAGNMFGQLGALQYSQNLAGAQQAMMGASAQPNYLQNLMNASAQNQSTMAAYPYNQSNWYGTLLQGIGPLTGTQQNSLGTALTSQQANAIMNSNGTTTPPQPNQFVQAAGLGLAGLGLLLNRGGAVPRRRGGMVPRMASGGTPYGGRSYIQPPKLAAPRMPVPSDTNLRVPSALTFPSMSTNGAGSAASAGSNSNTLGQLSSLLGNKQVASGIQGLGSSFFGNTPQASSTSVEAPGATVSVTDGRFRRGGLVPGFRRGGYADGGYAVENYDDYGDAPQRTGATWFDTSPSGYTGKGGTWSDSSGAREGPPASGARNEEPGIATPNRDTLGDFFQVQAPDGSWKITRQTDLGPGNEPRSRGIGLDVNAALADEMGYTPDNFPSGKAMNYRHLGAGPGLPEQMNAGLPDRRDAEAQSDIPTSGLGATAQSNRQPGGQQGGYRSFPIPGMEPRPQGILQRWASNPLTQFGLGLASARGSGLTGLAEGLNTGVGNVMAQRMAEDKLDRNYKIDTSGQRMRIILPNQVIETPFETVHADTARQRVAGARNSKIGQVPSGYRLSEDGTKLEPMPGGPKETGSTKGTSDATMDDDAARALALRAFESGNRMELSGLGTSKVGAANRALVNRHIKEAIENAAIENGTSEKEERAAYAQRQTEWYGRTAGQRALGTQEAKMGTAAEEARGAIGLARDAIEKVPRTGFLPFNRLIEGYSKQTLDPNQAALFARTQAVVNTYAAVMNRGASVTTDASRHRAEELLNTATDAATYNRVLEVMGSEIDMARNSPSQMREMYRKMYGGKAFEIEPTYKKTTEPTAKTSATPDNKTKPAAPAAPPEVGEVRKGYRFKGGAPSAPGSWEKVDEL